LDCPVHEENQQGCDWNESELIPVEKRETKKVRVPEVIKGHVKQAQKGDQQEKPDKTQPHLPS
jgi:hypothetical protein